MKVSKWKWPTEMSSDYNYYVLVKIDNNARDGNPKICDDTRLLICCHGPPLISFTHGSVDGSPVG